ncbi:putative membrane protein [Buttiauxella gaviniae ATCC 51604]|uniref:Putative membrane protein n=1 Tax=Buttiauxella gaviniae ATCC 51604 TaxID=1354253 RepID=A0A1B7HQB7_9ENTR|nr:PACE efflux transporter [Buttiauxella gaviniae]OAT17830.1 putative membrane protein [Buttiauxella gaviniae ATCC 51604]
MKVELNKSAKERLFHAVLFEIIANILIAVVMAFVLRIPLLKTSILSCVSALTAMAWNYIFNMLFDRLQQHYEFNRNLLVRILHAVGFEAGLILVLTPVAMFLLSLPLAGAFAVEIGLVLFFLPYTVVFNWLYDYVRWHLVSTSL